MCVSFLKRGELAAIIATPQGVRQQFALFEVLSRKWFATSVAHHPLVATCAIIPFIQSLESLGLGGLDVLDSIWLALRAVLGEVQGGFAQTSRVRGVFA
jgi:hypothetical protein